MVMDVFTFTGGGSVPITGNELLPDIQNKINELHLVYKVKCVWGWGWGAEWWCRMLVIVKIILMMTVLHYRDVLTSDPL